MGIYTDLASTSPIPGKPRVGLDRSSGEQLLSKAVQHDPPIRTAYAAATDVQVIAEQTDSGAADTYTLTFNYPNLAVGSFTTAAIAYDAVDTAIETAIDVAATAAGVTGWTNADISVSMGGAAGVSDGTVTITSDGASVLNEVADLVVLTATGFTKTGVATKTTSGTGDRKPVQALIDLNVVAGSANDPIDAPVWTRPASIGQTRPRYKLIRDLCIMAAAVDGNDNVYDAVVALYPGVAKV